MMIETDGLTKTYGHHTVVDNLTFQCSPGEVLGFLGPNGAGKSTTMKMVTGFVTPSAGRAMVCGYNVSEEPVAARQRLGYLPEGAALLPRDDTGNVPRLHRRRSRSRWQPAEKSPRRGDRSTAPASSAGSEHRHPVERIQTSRWSGGTGNRARSRRPHSRRADRRSRSEPKTRSPRTHPVDVGRQTDRHLNAYPRRSRSRLQSRDNYRRRKDPGRRYTASTGCHIRVTTTRCESYWAKLPTLTRFERRSRHCRPSVPPKPIGRNKRLSPSQITIPAATVRGTTCRRWSRTGTWNETWILPGCNWNLDA